jgi:hypothetical protein
MGRPETATANIRTSGGVCGLEMGSAYCKEADREKVFSEWNARTRAGPELSEAKGETGRQNVAPAFLSNDVGPDSPFLTWAFFRYGFLPNLLTYLPFSGTMLQNLALDRKMKSKSLDINHISLSEKWKERNE